MHGIVIALKESGLFKAIDVVELIDEESVKLIKVKAKVLDDTLLFITDSHTQNYQKYSYHWQKQDSEMILRWDNKPHWKNIKTFPHHKHEKDRVLPSHRVNIEDVLKEIKDRLKSI